MNVRREGHVARAAGGRLVLAGEGEPRANGNLRPDNALAAVEIVVLFFRMARREGGRGGWGVEKKKKKKKKKKKRGSQG